MAEKYSIRSIQDLETLRNSQIELHQDNTIGHLKFFLSEGHILTPDEAIRRTELRSSQALILVCRSCKVIFRFYRSNNHAEYPGIGPSYRCPIHR